jgi:hypothetical protein
MYRRSTGRAFFWAAEEGARRQDQSKPEKRIRNLILFIPDTNLQNFAS